MRIMVVEDDASKLSRIRDVLLEAGASEREIDFAGTGVDARKLLAEVQFDLLILDIALPMRADDKPDRRGGIRLLEEIVAGSRLRLPLSVVGLTGFEDLYHEFGHQFHSRLWTLDRYDASDTGWLDRLRAKVSYVVARARQGGADTYQTDICVVTALRSPELTALRKLPWEWKEPQSLDEVGFYYEGAFTCGGRSCSVVAAAAPRMGMVASALLAYKMATKFRPQYLAMVGICAGVRGRCDIGDVLVADPAWDWQMGKHEEEFSFAPHQIDMATQVREYFAQLSEKRDLLFSIHDSYTGAKPANVPRIRIGPVASGSAVLANAELVSQIQRQHRHLLGIEMELYGVYSASRAVSAPSPVAFGLKSVADFADNTKSDQFQDYSAHVSAQTLAEFCSRYTGG